MTPRESTKNTGRRGRPRSSPRPGGTRTTPRSAKQSALSSQAQSDRPNRPADGTLAFVPLGGLEEIGRNMMYFEYKDEIVIIDAGIQFPEEETPGIDFIIPNITSLYEKRDKVKALILTHAHFDHIGAIPYILEKIGNPIIYTNELTRALVQKRQEEFRNAPKPRFVIVKDGSKVRISEHFEAEFVEVAHTIPDSIGIILKTPVGNMVNLSDLRIDTDKKGNHLNTEVFKRAGKLGIHTLFLDSTSADIEGQTPSEETVEENLEQLFKSARGRIILSTFASMISRLDAIIRIAARLDRKVAIAGRSMKENLQISQNLGYVKPAKGLIIPLDDIQKYKDDKILVLCTGAQGQENAALMRIANGTHKQIQIKPDDMVVFSSSVIPGNERSVQGLKDQLVRLGADVVQSTHIDIHASGHGLKDELKEIIRLTNPRFIVPVHGYYYKRAVNCKNANEVGIPKNNCYLMDNGQVAEITDDSFRITNQTVPAFYVMVDGLGVGDVEEVVLRDRRVLAQEGMVVIITTIDRRNGRLLKNPDIISRGFIYLKDHKELLDEIRKKIRNIVGRVPRRPIDGDYLKSLMRDQIGSFLYTKTKRRPMILPVVIEI